MLVLKIGGAILEKGLGLNLVMDIRELLKKERIVVVHGGGDRVTEIAKRLGKEQVFIKSPSGISSRYTDRETVEIYTMVMSGDVNSRLVAFFLSQGISAVGLSGIDASLLSAARKKRLVIIDERGRRRIIKGGYTGKIEKVNTAFLEVLLQNSYVPVVSPIAIGREYEFLNVDSDRAAASIAGALHADRVVFLTDVEGVKVHGRYVDSLLLGEAEVLRREMGPGMDKKVLAAIEAVKAGVKEAIIASGFSRRPVTSAINHEAGTVISAN